MGYLTVGDIERHPDVLDAATELDRLLFEQSGVASVGQLGSVTTRSALRQRLRRGEWREEQPGVIVAHNGPLTDQQRLWIASLHAGAGRPALLGGRSALAVLGLRGYESNLIHVLIPAARRVSTLTGVALHRTTHLPSVDLTTSARPPCTAAARAVVDAASWGASDRVAATVVAMAFQQQLVGLSELHDALVRMPRAKRRALVWRFAIDAAGGAHALGELDLLALIRKAGLPEPALQQVRTDAAGRRRYLDLYWPAFKLHVEVDGAHHLGVVQAWADMQRQNAVWVPGDRVLRFPGWAVRADSATVLAQIRAALIAAGWRP